MLTNPGPFRPPDPPPPPPPRHPAYPFAHPPPRTRCSPTARPSPQTMSTAAASSRLGSRSIVPKRLFVSRQCLHWYVRPLAASVTSDYCLFHRMRAYRQITGIRINSENYTSVADSVHERTKHSTQQGHTDMYHVRTMMLQGHFQKKNKNSNLTFADCAWMAHSCLHRKQLLLHITVKSIKYVLIYMKQRAREQESKRARERERVSIKNQTNNDLCLPCWHFASPCVWADQARRLMPW